VIVDNLDIFWPGFRPAEAHSPLVVDADAVLSLTISCQRLQPIARRRCQKRQRFRRVQLRQLARGHLGDRAELLRASRFKELLSFLAAVYRLPVNSKCIKGLGSRGVEASSTRTVAAVGTTDSDKVMTELKQMKINDMFAKNGYIRTDGVMIHDIYVMQVKSPRESKYPWDYYKVVKQMSGEEAFGPVTGLCPLAPK